MINLLPEDNKYATTGEKESIEKNGIKYIHIPINWDQPKISDYNTFESNMNAYKNNKIHIHCAANYRVTAFYGIYACNNRGWSDIELNNFIDSIWDISEHPVWEEFVSDDTKI